MNSLRLKNKIRNISLLFGSLLISLLIVEGLSRLIYPIKLNLLFIYSDGETTWKQKWRLPGKIYRQVSDEYDALTTITSKGYRVPDIKTRQPEIVFCGDSFTFGEGLSDEETFVYQFAQSTGVISANLGDPGAGTRRELDLLLKFISEENWRPQQVWLFMTVMTDSFFFAGNDLADNLIEDIDVNKKERVNANRATDGENVSREVDRITLLRKIRDLLVEESNMVRLIQFVMAPKIKLWLSSGPKDSPNLYKRSLNITCKQLLRLKQMSEQYGFKYKIFIIHPFQDIIKKNNEQTYITINQISPIPVIDTAYLFKRNPEKCYYRYDQHFSKDGASRIAQFLIEYYKKEDEYRK